MTLERRYRRLLTVLPAPYRQAWEDDMVATFLQRMTTGDPDSDELAQEFGRPEAGEVLSVLALAIRLRLAGPDAEPPAAMWGEAVRFVALTSLLFGALSLPLALAQLWWLSAGLWLPPEIDLSAVSQTPAWQEALDWVALVGWPAAFLAVLFAGRSAALILAVVAFAPSLGAAVVHTAQALAGAQPWHGSATSWSVVVAQAVVVVSLFAFHETAPRPAPGPWLRRLVIGALVAPAVGVLMLLQPPERMLLNPVSLVALLWLFAAARARSTRPNALSLTLLGLVVLVLCCGWLLDATLPTGQSPLVGGAAAALTAACAVMTLMLFRDIRHQLQAVREPPYGVTPLPPWTAGTSR